MRAVRVTITSRTSRILKTGVGIAVVLKCTVIQGKSFSSQCNISTCVIFSYLDSKCDFQNVCLSEERFPRGFYSQDIFANLFHICKSSFTIACNLNFYSNCFLTVPILFIASLYLDVGHYHYFFAITTTDCNFNFVKCYINLIF